MCVSYLQRDPRYEHFRLKDNEGKASDGKRGRKIIVVPV